MALHSQSPAPWHFLSHLKGTNPMESSWPRMAAGPEGGRLSYLVPKMELWVSGKFTRVHPWGSGQSCERRLQPLDLAVTLPGAEGQLGHSSLVGHLNKSARVWFFGFGSGFCLFVCFSYQ